MEEMPFALHALKVAPGDIIVVMLEDYQSIEYCKDIRRQVQEAIPGHPVIILDPGVTIDKIDAIKNGWQGDPAQFTRVV